MQSSQSMTPQEFPVQLVQMWKRMSKCNSNPKIIIRNYYKNAAFSLISRFKKGLKNWAWSGFQPEAKLFIWFPLKVVICSTDCKERGFFVNKHPTQTILILSCFCSRQTYRVRQKYWYAFLNGCGIEMVQAKSVKFLTLFYHCIKQISWKY